MSHIADLARRADEVVRRVREGEDEATVRAELGFGPAESGPGPGLVEIPTYIRAKRAARAELELHREVLAESGWPEDDIAALTPSEIAAQAQNILNPLQPSPEQVAEFEANKQAVEALDAAGEAGRTKPMEYWNAINEQRIREEGPIR